MQGFRHVHPIEVRFRDIDVLGHVNNSVMFTFIESARVPYMIAAGIRPPGPNLNEIGLIVAHINCDFRQPIFYGQKVEVGTRVVEVKRTSMRLEHRVEADGQLAAEGYCILVHYDYSAHRSVPVTPDMLVRLETFEGKRLRSQAGP